MSEPRSTPHRGRTPALQEVILEGRVEQFESLFPVPLSGNNDDNLATVFNGLLTTASELASLRYFYSGAPADAVVDLIATASLAAANAFRMLGVESDPVQFEWDGQTRSVPAVPHPDLLIASKVQFGLVCAILAGRQGDIDLLGRLPEEAYTHPQIEQNESTLNYTRYFQLLARGVDEGLVDLQSRLKGQLDRKNDVESKYSYSKYVMYLAIAEGDPVLLKTQVEAHLAAHKKMYDSNRGNMRNVALGYYSMNAMAVIVLAQQRGMDISVSNDYIPVDLLEEILGRASK